MENQKQCQRMSSMNGYDIFSLLRQQVVLARELSSSREYASEY